MTRRSEAERDMASDDDVEYSMSGDDFEVGEYGLVEETSQALTEAVLIAALKDLQSQAGANSVNKGFWADDPTTDLKQYGVPDEKIEHLSTVYDTMKLILMVSEVIEAFEELRSGHAPGEVYYTIRSDRLPEDPSPENDALMAFIHKKHTQDQLDMLIAAKLVKPEGVVVELADCIIRIWDYCERRGLPLAEQILAKMGFNATRAYMHDRQF